MVSCKIGLVAALLAVAQAVSMAAEMPRVPAKKAGVFMPPELVAKARANAAKYAWAAEMRDKAVRDAEPWMKLSDDELWGLMFGPTIPRSWMVWSDGFCPACKASVPMYNWKMDPFEHPWKVQCPHCGELFPKNDFGAFYRSGLDKHGVFDPKLADRSLLFSADHPDPKDPLHAFGVDDGTGYVDSENHKWRFIGCYLIYGQWKKAIIDGVARLGTAYAMTGDAAYAHKAGILLDRVADLYPTFDYMSQGEVYEKHDANGYVSVWHDACGETRTLALAYDQVFDGIKNDDALVRFLSGKAKRYRLDVPKSTFADVQRNIEDRILRDAMANRKKIESNYPQTDLNFAIFSAILDWPASRPEVNRILGAIIDKDTAVDGLSGEKGLAGYSAWAVATLAEMLELFSRVEPDLLAQSLKQHPNLSKTWQFYIDAWCLQAYYPNVGDSGMFVSPCGFNSISLGRSPGVGPSGFAFLGHLYEATRNPSFLQLAYIANSNSVEGLPYSIFADDPTALQNKIKKLIDREGTSIKVGSANKEQWHLALMRSGEKDKARVVWMDYDSNERHSHADCMNLGIYAYGIDLMADFGYPPVQYGGWNAPKAQWFIHTASHNTVVVNGARQPALAGSSTMWIDKPGLHVVRASAPGIAGKQYERTVAMVDISDDGFYALDIFRVVGGKDHAKFMHTQRAALSSQGLTLAPSEDYGYGTFFRASRTDPAPKPGWSADWAIDDQLKRATPGPDVHVKYTDLTQSAQATTCEAWVSLGISTNNEVWIPELIVRRKSGTEPLASTFVGVIEPYHKQSGIASIRRLALQTPNGESYGDASVAVEITLADGRRDVLIAADVENPLGLTPSLARDKTLVQKDTGIELSGEFCAVRFTKTGELEKVLACTGGTVRVGGKPELDAESE